MNKRKLVIESCTECPFLKTEPDYTADSFETCTAWICKRIKDYVRRYVDWNDHSKYIPNECPLPKTR